MIYLTGYFKLSDLLIYPFVFGAYITVYLLISSIIASLFNLPDTIDSIKNLRDYYKKITKDSINIIYDNVKSKGKKV